MYTALHPSEQRKAENRTKIQLGGLIIKAGLSELLGITPGEDLQLDPQALDKATVLLGALIDAVERAKDDVRVRDTWAFLGEKAMRQSFIQDKHSAR